MFGLENGQIFGTGTVLLYCRRGHSMSPRWLHCLLERTWHSFVRPLCSAWVTSLLTESDDTPLSHRLVHAERLPISSSQQWHFVRLPRPRRDSSQSHRVQRWFFCRIALYSEITSHLIDSSQRIFVPMTQRTFVLSSSDTMAWCATPKCFPSPL
jgi:hypothetical protein